MENSARGSKLKEDGNILSAHHLKVDSSNAINLGNKTRKKMMEQELLEQPAQ